MEPEQEIALDRAKAALDAMANHPTWAPNEQRYLLEQVKEYADDLLFNIGTSTA